MTDIDESTRTIKYLPLRLTNSLGGDAILRATNIQRYTVLSGLITFAPESSDLKKLARWAENRLGIGFLLVLIAPKGFAVRVLDGKEVLWERKLASGSAHEIPIQFTVYQEQLRGEHHFSAEVVLKWEGATPRIAKRLRIDWVRIQSALSVKNSDGRGITEETLNAVCVTAVDLGWIKVEAPRSSLEPAQKIELVASAKTLIVGKLLKQLDAAQTDGQSPTNVTQSRPGRVFNLREDFRTELLVTTVDIATNAGTVERSLTFTQQINWR